MKHKFGRIGFLAALCLLCIGAALAVHLGISHRVLAVLFTIAGPLGTVTITNLYPFTTTPTSAQMNGGNPTSGPTGFNMIVATVAASAAADTSASITHNFGLSAAEITQGFPKVVIVPQDGNAITSPWWEASENPNYTILQKGTVAIGGTIKLEISRPFSESR